MASKKFGLRAVFQIFFTGLTVITGITAFSFAFMFEQFMDEMLKNYKGDLTTTSLPCLRSTLDECDPTVQDKCYTYCCPQGYFCARSPIVGLYCQDGTVVCGNFNWCRDFADIPGTCATVICKTHQTILRVTSWSFILAAVGVFVDFVDVIAIFTLPDSVIFKSGVNVFSSLVKWIAFGCLVGAGTAQFLSELGDARCFNTDGMQLTADTGGMFLSYCTVQVVSAVASLILAPLSAFYGGHLTGVPYVK